MKRRKRTGKKGILRMIFFLIAAAVGFAVDTADMPVCRAQSSSEAGSGKAVSAKEAAGCGQSSYEAVLKTAKTTVSVRKVKLAKKAKKTFTEKGKVQKKIRTEIRVLSEKIIKVRTVTKKRTTSKYKKGSKICTRKTTTTVVTVTEVQEAAKGKAAVSAVAPGIDDRVLNAYTALGFTIRIDPGVSYAGMFDAGSRSIVLKKSGDTVYHELGHFVAFAAGNIDRQEAFVQIFEQEKSKYTKYNKAYVLQDSSEYFAESFKNYTLEPKALKTDRPLTYAAVRDALDTITGEQTEKIRRVYQAVWEARGG